MRTKQPPNAMGLMLIIALLIGCSKDTSTTDPDPNNQPPEQENQAPLSFNLLGVDDGDFEVELSPQLSWEESMDPDGDTVAYDLYLDRNSEPKLQLANELNATSYQLESSLNRNTEYFWNVEAKDGKGGVTSSDIRSFLTRTIKVPAVAEISNAGFSERAFHSTLLFQDNLWLIGEDVWRSWDGLQWIQMVSETDFAPPAAIPAVSFDDKLFILKGAANEIWYSTDGTNWITLNATQPFSERFGHSAVVFNEKIWVIGGNDTQGNFTNDVWSSTNGLNWELVTLSADFPVRYGHNCFVYDNKIWILGGYNPDTGLLGDIWNSSDGINWVSVTSFSGLPPRQFAALAVWDNDLILYGGEGGFTGTVLSNTNQIETLDDIWHSTDGENWQMVGSITPRSGHTLTDLDGKLLLIGGAYRTGFNNFDVERTNDVWLIE